MITAVILSAASDKVLADDTSACNCESFKEVVEVQQEEISSLHRKVTSQGREIISIKETLSTLVNVVCGFTMSLQFLLH